MTTGQGKTDPNAAERFSCLIRQVIEIHQFFPHPTQPRGDSKTFSGLKFDSSAATLFLSQVILPKVREKATPSQKQIPVRGSTVCLHFLKGSTLAG